MWFGLTTFTESIAETAAHNLQITATSCSSCLPAFSFLRPIVCMGKWEEIKHRISRQPISVYRAIFCLHQSMCFANECMENLFLIFNWWNENKKSWIPDHNLPSVAWDTNQRRNENASSKTQAHSKHIQFDFLKLGHLHDRVLAAGYPHWAQIDFWMWYDERPHRRHNVCVLLWRFPKLDVPFV